MPNSFQGIETASRALRAFQRGLDTVGHNVANADTVGYSRQTAGYRTTDAVDIRQGAIHSLGTGVELAQITRIKSDFLTLQRNGAESEMGRLSGGEEGLRSVEGAFLDVDGKGIASGLDRFFGSWSALASNPGESANKLSVQTAGRELAASIRGTAARVLSAQAQASTEVARTLDEAGKLTRKIAGLNDAVVGATAQGAVPNDLLDERDRSVLALSRIVDVRTDPQPNGALAVSLGGITLVDSAGARPFPTDWDAATGALSDGRYTYRPASGALKGLAETQAGIADVKARLDGLANTLRTATNTLHAAGPGGLDFFADVPPGDPQTGAGDLRLDAAVEADYNQVATGAEPRRRGRRDRPRPLAAQRLADRRPREPHPLAGPPRSRRRRGAHGEGPRRREGRPVVRRRAHRVARPGGLGGERGRGDGEHAPPPALVPGRREDAEHVRLHDRGPPRDAPPLGSVPRIAPEPGARTLLSATRPQIEPNPNARLGLTTELRTGVSALRGMPTEAHR